LKKRATAKAKGEDDGVDDAALRVPLIKSEEVQKIKGQMAVGGGEDCGSQVREFVAC